MKEIDANELKNWLDEGRDFQLIDVREIHENEAANLGGILIPMGEVLSRIEEVNRQGDVVIYCRSGGRSGNIVQHLENLGFTNVINLKGGCLGWKRDIDPTLNVS
jgi:adenylyltransferase/sulfurtransferase